MDRFIVINPLESNFFFLVLYDKNDLFKSIYNTKCIIELLLQYFTKYMYFNFGPFFRTMGTCTTHIQ